MAVYVQITLKHAEDLNASNYLDASTSVYAKVKHRDLTYTTGKVKDMGNNPVWRDKNTFDFFIEPNEKEAIILSLFKKRDKFIGAAKVTQEDIMNLKKEKNETIEKAFSVNVQRSHERTYGKLFLKIQRKHEQAAGKVGLMRITLVGGDIEKLTSFWRKTAEVHVKLSYENFIQYKSEVLERSKNKFEWGQNSDSKTYTFAVNDKSLNLTLAVYNYNKHVASCNIRGTEIMEPNVGVIDYQKDLLNAKGNVGTITFKVDTRPLKSSNKDVGSSSTHREERGPLERGRRIVEPNLEDVHTSHHINHFPSCPTTHESPGFDQVPVREFSTQDQRIDKPGEYKRHLF